MFGKLVLAMMLAHFVADFTLQGILADLKQRRWWQKKVQGDLDRSKYRDDYIVALFVHSMYWSACVVAPFAFTGYVGTTCWSVLFAINSVIHAGVDHLKANERDLNLVQDQCIHGVQLVVTAFIMLIAHHAGAK